MSSNYAEIKNNLVTNVIVADQAYAQDHGLVLLTDGAGIGWSYTGGKFYPPAAPQPTPDQIKAANKSQAESLLQSTDWTATVDISNPQYSNPYLGNQDAFLAYRSQVRQIAVNPPTTPAAFPTAPKEVWVTV